MKYQTVPSVQTDRVVDAATSPTRAINASHAAAAAITRISATTLMAAA